MGSKTLTRESEEGEFNSWAKNLETGQFQQQDQGSWRFLYAPSPLDVSSN